MSNEVPTGLERPRSAHLAAGFAARFDGPPGRFARAPGRVNLIGDHIDYHGGAVLPLPLGLDTAVAFRPRDDGAYTIGSDGYPDPARFASVADAAAPPGDWRRYIGGIITTLADDGVRPRGIDAFIHSTVPEGGGLSSSASLLVALGAALLDAAGETLDPARLARAGRAAEHRFAWVESGIMDFIAATAGGDGGPLFLDCLTGESERIDDAPDGTVWRIVSSGVKHELGSSAYNRRVAECRDACGRLGVARLLEASVTEDAVDALPALLARRVRHVRSEHRRVLDARVALRDRDAVRVGALMTASHASLRDDYEVSCPEIDTLVDAACEVEGVYGSRITGGGFGGSTVTLLDAGSVEAFDGHVTRAYRRACHATPKLIDARPGRGVEVGDFVARLA